MRICKLLSAQEGRNDQQTPQMAKMNVIVANRADEAENEVVSLYTMLQQSWSRSHVSIILI